MIPDEDRQNWVRLYAGLALIGLASTSADPKAIALTAFEIAEAMVDQGGFDD
jgi:hypothetical protein